MTNKNDIYGEALLDFLQNNESTEPLLLHSSYGDVEEMPVEIFYREPEEFSELEIFALAFCDGKVLDVGAGVGVHALYLQEQGFDVTAIESSKIACAIMKDRGVKDILNEDFFQFQKGQFDTLLFLMNGIGIAGSIEGLKRLLIHAKELLTDRGQLLFDSSDINYLYQEYRIARPQHYYGEINYQYEFKGKKGEHFNWLYIDQNTLIKIGQELGWVVQILFEDDNDQYLARMEVRKEQL